GEWLDLAVEFIAGGISMHARMRRPPPGQQDAGAAPGPLPERPGSPARIRGVDRGDMVEANEYYLPMVGDHGRHEFYQRALLAALEARSAAGARPTVLDCSGGGGAPSLLAASRLGVQALTLTQRTEFAKALREVAGANGVGELVEAYAVRGRSETDIWHDGVGVVAGVGVDAAIVLAQSALLLTSVSGRRWPGARRGGGIGGDAGGGCALLVGMPKGTIKKFFEDKGFGFITPEDGGEDVFVHRKVNGADRTAYLEEGDAVEYELEWDDRKGKYCASAGASRAAHGEDGAFSGHGVLRRGARGLAGRGAPVGR
ncbi:unnamed protein product, partial [Prorocentrum cordatum]